MTIPIFDSRKFLRRNEFKKGYDLSSTVSQSTRIKASNLYGYIRPEQEHNLLYKESEVEQNSLLYCYQVGVYNLPSLSSQRSDLQALSLPHRYRAVKTAR